MYTLHCTYMNSSPPVKPIATTTSLVQNGHSKIPGREKIKKERKRTRSVLAGLHWISQKHPLRKLSQSLGHVNYCYFAIFIRPSPHPHSPSSQTHADFCFTYHTYSHPPEEKQNNWSSVPEPLCSTITDRVKATARNKLRSFYTCF